MLSINCTDVLMLEIWFDVLEMYEKVSEILPNVEISIKLYDSLIEYTELLTQYTETL